MKQKLLWTEKTLLIGGKIFFSVNVTLWRLVENHTLSGRHTPNPMIIYTIRADIGELRIIFSSPVFVFLARFSEPHFLILWSTTVQTHGNMESGIFQWCSSFNYFWNIPNAALKLLETISSSGRLRVPGFDDSWFRGNQRQTGSGHSYREQSLGHEC